MFLAPASSGNTLRYAITTTSTGGEQQINNNAILSTGVWHHVAVTLSGTNGLLYLDGVAVGTNSSMTLRPSILGNTTQNYLGKSQWPDPVLIGNLDDFRIYNRALSAAEISSLTNFPATPAGLTATAGDARFGLSRNVSSGAASYNVKRSTISGGPYITVTNLAALNFTNTGLANGTLYYFAVSATNAAGESTNSAQVSARSVSLVSAPLTSMVSSGQLQLSWPTDHTGWRLQMQTNSLGQGLGTNWTTVAGSTNGNQAVIPVNVTNPSVFLRLIYP
jgi:hypothetical protein